MATLMGIEEKLAKQAWKNAWSHTSDDVFAVLGLGFRV
jgi:hypothetical protein